MLFNWLVLLVGVVASAVSFVFIRESSEPPVMLAAYRVLLAGLLLLPIYIIQRRKHGDETTVAILKRSFLPALVLCLHFITWVIGARMTPAANATIIVNLMPVVMPLLMYQIYAEAIRRHEIIATTIAIIGVLLLAQDDFSISPRHFAGDMICLLSMLLFAVYLAISRRYRDLPSIWLYVVPLYLTAGFITFLIALFFSNPLHPYTPYNALMIFLTAAISTVVGHSALNYAMQQFRGQTVTIVNMGQFAVAGVFGYLIYREVPSATFYLAGILLLVSMGLIVLRDSRIE